MKLRLLCLMITATSVTTVFGAPQETVSAAPVDAAWLTNVSAAFKQANEEGKAVLLSFTGSDWCKWCKVLNEEVLASDDFCQEIPQRFVLVSLDFPADPENQNPRLAKQNHEWLEKLGVDGFPTVVLCDASGRPFSSRGYQQGGAKPYVESLLKDHGTRLKRNRMLARASQLGGLDKARLLDQALRSLDEAIVARHYSDEVTQILSLGAADNELATRYQKVQLLGKQLAALSELRGSLVGADVETLKQRLDELEVLFVEPGEARERFLQEQVQALSAVEAHRRAVNKATELLRSGKPSTAAFARELTLQSLLELGELQSVIDTLARWKMLSSNDRKALQPYQIEALIGLDRVDEAVKLAREAADGDAEDPVIAWMRLVVREDGNVPNLREFLRDRSVPPLSRFWIGVSVECGKSGFVIVEVVPGGPADQAGIRRGDVVLTAGGNPMESEETLLRAIADAGDTRTVAFDLLRAGDKTNVEVQPATRPTVGRGFELAPIPADWDRSLATALKRSAAGNQEILVYFSAKWCGPCQAMLRESFSDKRVRTMLTSRVVAHIDLDSLDGAKTADRYRIDAVPTLLYLDARGREVGRSSGFQDAQQLLRSLEVRGSIAKPTVSHDLDRPVPDPGPEFVPYPGGDSPVDDAGILGAVLHRYRELREDERWPAQPRAAPVSVSKADPNPAKGCTSAAELARATLIIAGGDPEAGDFFTAGAVLITSDGLAITNQHVVHREGRRLAAMDSAGKMHRVVEVLAANPTRDIALIRIDGSEFHAVKIAASPAEVGADLMMMCHGDGRFFTCHRGYVMRYAKVGKNPRMEIAASYSARTSGCGIFNSRFELVGISSPPRTRIPSDRSDLGVLAGIAQRRQQLNVRHAVSWSAIQDLWQD